MMPLIPVKIYLKEFIINQWSNNLSLALSAVTSHTLKVRKKDLNLSLLIKPAKGCVNWMSP